MSLRTAESEVRAPRPSGAWSGFRDRLVTAGRGTEAVRIRELLGSGPSRRLLDVGGRTGAFTTRFAPPEAGVTVLEPEGDIVRAAERRHPEIRFVTGHGEKLPFPDATFDRVTAIRSTHHMEAPEQFFREALRVLTPGGRLVVEELAPSSGLAKLFSRLMRRRHHHRPMDFRGPPDWVRGVTDAAFELVTSDDGARWFFVTGRKPAPTAPA